MSGTHRMMAETSSGYFMRMIHGVKRPLLVSSELSASRPTMTSMKASKKRAIMNMMPTMAPLMPKTLV